jgi:HK97 family phage portal protein
MMAHGGDPFTGMYGSFVPSQWISSLSDAGIRVTPEYAMTLSAFYSGVTMIASDLATLPLQVFREREDGGKDRIRGGPFQEGIGGLAYRLRWQPNQIQSATECLMGMVAQLLMREWAYAEIVGGPTTGLPTQYLPRHPDRVTPERLPSGRLRFKLTESNGQPRYVTQDEMWVIRGLSFDGGLSVASRVQFGANALGTAIAARAAQARFFKSGMTTSLVASYKGGAKEDEDEDALHKSITRYATGVENSFGLMLIPDDVTIDSLGIEPEKAQMMLAQEWGVREVARVLSLPGYKLGIKDSQGYASAVQAALDYIVTSLRPRAVTIEQSIKRDLIIAKDVYIAEFKLEALMRGDFESQATYLEKFIQNRIMRPSEARLILNLNPDPALDKLSEGDMRPGTPRDRQPANDQNKSGRESVLSRAGLRATLAVHDNALRCLRREQAAVSKLATRHANNPAGWKAGLQEFYGEHAGFVSQIMRLDPEIARGYAAQHGSEFAENGAPDLLDDKRYAEWERFEAEELTALSLMERQEAA